MKYLMMIGVAISFLATTSCRTIKPYEKEYLLSPLMDNATFSPVSLNYSSRMLSRVEKLSESSASSSSGSSCPTCGG